MCGMRIRADAAHKTGPGCGRCLEGAIKGCPNSTKGSQADIMAHSVDVLSVTKFSCADCSYARRAVALWKRSTRMRDQRAELGFTRGTKHHKRPGKQFISQPNIKLLP